MSMSLHFVTIGYDRAHLVEGNIGKKNPQRAGNVKHERDANSSLKGMKINKPYMDPMEPEDCWKSWKHDSSNDDLVVKGLQNVRFSRGANLETGGEGLLPMSTTIPQDRWNFWKNNCIHGVSWPSSQWLGTLQAGTAASEASAGGSNGRLEWWSSWEGYA